MTIRKTALGLTLIGALMGVSACSNDPQINAMTGALAGAAAGSQIGDGSGRKTAILAGAAAGAAVGGNASNMSGY